MKWYYLHTYHGKPAFFDGTGIYLISSGGCGVRGPRALCASLEEIRRQQSVNFESWVDCGLDYNPADWSYVRVTLPERKALVRQQREAGR